MIASAFGHWVKSASAQMMLLSRFASGSGFSSMSSCSVFSEFPRFDDFQLFREHEGDFGQLDGERNDVDAEELVERDGAFERLAFAHFAEAQKNVALEPLHLAIRNEKKISRTARGVEHAERAKIDKRLAQFPDVLARGIDPLAPLPDDCWTDDFANVELAREVCAVRVALITAAFLASVHAVLKQRAENFRPHLAPILNC